ncbi:hypothetical protein J6590_094963 [Homalodisca vitripennis]|nr:hypothetical protein J6590_094963 [Homalodisca vitripennis]
MDVQFSFLFESSSNVLIFAFKYILRRLYRISLQHSFRYRTTDKVRGYATQRPQAYLICTGIGNEISPQVTAEINWARLVANISTRVSEIVNANLTVALTAANNRIDQVMSEVRLRAEAQYRQKALYYLAQNEDNIASGFSAYLSLREEDTDVFREKLGVKIEPQNICRSHRVDHILQLVKFGKNERPIFGKFISYRHRREVYYKKSSRVTIRVVLTAALMETLKRATEELGPMSVWTLDGRVF